MNATVVVEAVVNEKGCAQSIRVVKKVNPQLERLAKRTWKFTSATKDGKPVAVMVRIEVELKDNEKYRYHDSSLHR